MDLFFQIYHQMLKNTPNQLNAIINSQYIINKLIKHINLLILFLDLSIQKQLKLYIFLISSQGYNISNFIEIYCIDLVKNKYQLILKNLKTLFYVLHSSLTAFLKQNVLYNSGFYCGDFNKNIKSEAIYISLKPIKFKKSYLNNKKILILQRNNIKLNQNNTIQYKELTINDILLQYIGYFRNK